MTDGFLALRKVKLLDDPLAVGVAQSKAECESACLKSCSCQAYAFSNGDCAVWPGDLRNVQQLYADSGVSGSDLYLRLSATGLRDLHSADRKKGENHWLILGMTMVGVLAFGASLILGWRILGARRRRLANMANENSLTVYSYGDLRAATKNFSERLGGGGFGSVSHGVLKQQVQVAVKKLEARAGENGTASWSAWREG